MNKPLHSFADAAVISSADAQKQIAVQSILILNAKVFPHHRLRHEEQVIELVHTFVNPGKSKSAFGSLVKILHDRLHLEANEGVRFPEAMDCMELKKGPIADLSALRKQQLADLNGWCQEAGIRINRGFNIYTALYGMTGARPA